MAQPRPERPTISSVIAANPDTFAKLLRYSLALFGLSLGCFLALSSARLGLGARLTGIEAQGARDVVAAAAAVTVAWLVIAAYVVDAWLEPDEPSPREQQHLRAAARAAARASANAASAANAANADDSGAGSGANRAADADGARRRGAPRS